MEPTRYLRDKTLSELAKMIAKDWTEINIRAELCLATMNELDSIEDSYYEDSGESIILHFLCNAVSWRGGLSQMIKRELNRRLTRR
jgi:uncharacterized coiled-coil protein SlyX